MGWFACTYSTLISHEFLLLSYTQLYEYMLHATGTYFYTQIEDKAVVDLTSVVNGTY